MRGHEPSLAINSKCCLADKDGLAASLLDRFLSSLRELVSVNGDGGLDLSVIEHFDETVLLAEEPQVDDLVEGEFGHVLGSDDLSHAIEAEDGVLDAEDVGKAALG